MMHMVRKFHRMFSWHQIQLHKWYKPPWCGILWQKTRVWVLQKWCEHQWWQIFSWHQIQLHKWYEPPWCRIYGRFMTMPIKNTRNGNCSNSKQKSTRNESITTFHHASS